jgi:hypothetical protein
MTADFSVFLFRNKSYLYSLITFFSDTNHSLTSTQFLYLAELGIPTATLTFAAGCQEERHDEQARAGTKICRFDVIQADG